MMPRALLPVHGGFVATRATAGLKTGISASISDQEVKYIRTQFRASTFCHPIDKAPWSFVRSRRGRNHRKLLHISPAGAVSRRLPSDCAACGIFPGGTASVARAKSQRVGSNTNARDRNRNSAQSPVSHVDRLCLHRQHVRQTNPFAHDFLLQQPRATRRDRNDSMLPANRHCDATRSFRAPDRLTHTYRISRAAPASPVAAVCPSERTPI